MLPALVRKWLNRPKRSDTRLLAQFFYADEDVTRVVSELHCLEMQKDPQHYLSLLNQLHATQERMLTLITQISEQCIPQQLHRREYQVKFPDELLNDNMSTHMLFAAELLVSGTYIEVDEADGIMLSPLAREVLYSLEELRTLLREQSLTDPSTYTESIHKALIQFDALSAEFELRYVSLVVSVKTPEEIFKQQEIVVLFCETITRALKLGYLTQDMIDVCEPQLMFTIPRLSIISGLLIYPDGPLNLQRRRDDMSKLFSPFYGLLKKIRDLLYVLSEEELFALEKSLCSTDSDDHHATLTGFDGLQPETTNLNPQPDLTSLVFQTDSAILRDQSDLTTLALSSKPRARSMPPATTAELQERWQGDGSSQPADFGMSQHRSALWSRQVVATSNVSVLTHSEAFAPKTFARNLGEVQMTELNPTEWETTRPQVMSQCMPYFQKHGSEGITCAASCSPGHCYSEWVVHAGASKSHPGATKNSALPKHQNTAQEVLSIVHHWPPHKACFKTHNEIPEEVILPPSLHGDTQEPVYSNHDTSTQNFVSPKLHTTCHNDTSLLHHNSFISRSSATHCMDTQNTDSSQFLTNTRALTSVDNQNNPRVQEASLCHDDTREYGSCPPHDSFSPVYQDLNQVSDYPMHSGVPQDSTHVLHNEIPQGMASSSSVPPGAEPSMHNSAPQDCPSLMHQGIPQVSASPIEQGVPQDSASRMLHNIPQDSASPMHQGVPQDCASPMYHKGPQDPASPMHQVVPQFSASPMHQGVLLDSASPMHHKVPQNSASPMHQEDSQVFASTMYQVVPQVSASPTQQGVPLDYASPVHHKVPQDSASSMRHGIPQNFAYLMQHWVPRASASPMLHRVHQDCAFPTLQGVPQDGNSPMHHRVPQDWASTLHNRVPQDHAYSLHHREHHNTSIHYGAPQDSPSSMHHSMPQKSASSVHPGVAQDSTTPMNHREPQDSATPTHHGVPRDCPSSMYPVVAKDSTSAIYHGVPPDSPSAKHYGTSQDTFSTMCHGVFLNSSYLNHSMMSQDSVSQIHHMPRHSAPPMYRRVPQVFASPTHYRFPQSFTSTINHWDLVDYPLSLHHCGSNSDVPEHFAQNAAFMNSVGPPIADGISGHPQSLLWMEDSCVVDNFANLERAMLSGSSQVPGMTPTDSGNFCLFRQATLPARDVMRSNIYSDTALEHCQKMGPQSLTISPFSRHQQQNSRHNDELRKRGLQEDHKVMRREIRLRYRSTSDMLHRLFVCIAGVADQLQTNFASDLRPILKTVFEIAASKPDACEISDVFKNEEIRSPNMERRPGKQLEDCALCFDINLLRAEDAESVPHANEPPEWVPDSASSNCMDCQAPFTLVRRRHHCRSCGKIFCSRCSSHMVPLPHFGHSKAVRVCNHCFTTHLYSRPDAML